MARRILVAVLGLMVTVTAMGEHLSRRMAERRYQQAVEVRQQLERNIGGILSSHRQLVSELETERKRTEELSKAVAEKNAELERAIGRLAQETQTIRELEQQLRVHEQRMAQLQGELSDALEGRQAPTAAVELEQIVVSSEAASTLQGRVISVHPEWDFVVIDLGWDAVKIGDTVTIVRNNELLAKAKVERVQEGVCAATVLPEWDAGNVQVNDDVQLL
jgi:peptidoglycan hydrolase CwlO-like protein